METPEAPAMAARSSNDRSRSPAVPPVNLGDRLIERHGKIGAIVYDPGTTLPLFVP
jgi:hypothetical protein